MQSFAIVPGGSGFTFFKGLRDCAGFGIWHVLLLNAVIRNCSWWFRVYLFWCGKAYINMQTCVDHIGRECGRTGKEKGRGGMV
jgi:hypothetical protein